MGKQLLVHGAVWNNSTRSKYGNKCMVHTFAEVGEEVFNNDNENNSWSSGVAST